MAIGGRKPSSKADKKARGENRPCRQGLSVVNGGAEILEFPVVSDVPKAPDHLSEKAVEIWDRIATLLHYKKVLTDADLPALAHLCYMNADITKRQGVDADVSASEYAQLKGYFVEFGMTPASRMRIGVGGNNDKGNQFGNNGTKPKPKKSAKKT